MLLWFSAGGPRPSGGPRAGFRESVSRAPHLELGALAHSVENGVGGRVERREILYENVSPGYYACLATHTANPFGLSLVLP